MARFGQRVTTSLTAAAVFLGMIGLTPASANAASQGTNPGTSSLPTPPAIKAQSAILIDAANGQVLFQKNPNARRAPASTTKIMSMLLVMQAVAQHRASWNEYVPVTPDAYQVAAQPDVSDAYLDPREHFTLKKMMQFIAVLSANDATIAVADKLGGDKQGFVNMMNAEAQKLGLTGTHYQNPDGLQAPQHYSTAHDLVTLARTLITQYPDILKFTSMQKVTAPKDVVRLKPETWDNTDSLLGNYPGLDGLKTGYTNEAGYCFVGTAIRNGHRLIVAVMGDPDISSRFADSAALLDYGFQQYHSIQLAAPNAVLSQTVDVPNGSNQRLTVSSPQGISVDVPNGASGDLVLDVPPLSAPISAGQKVGELTYSMNGKVIVSQPVFASTTDGQANFMVRWMRQVSNWVRGTLHG